MSVEQDLARFVDRQATELAGMLLSRYPSLSRAARRAIRKRRRADQKAGWVRVPAKRLRVNR